mgnify:CR=1 FL=1
MNLDFQRLMKAATRFTRGGDLRAATAAIQSALMRNAPARERPPTDDIIDVQANEVAAASQALHSQTAPPPAATAQPLGGGEFIAGRFATATDGRDYKLYIPPQAGRHPLPLVVMLHGCGQDPDGFAGDTRMNELAERETFLVAYPEQDSAANGARFVERETA